MNALARIKRDMGKIVSSPDERLPTAVVLLASDVVKLLDVCDAAIDLLGAPNRVSDEDVALDNAVYRMLREEPTAARPVQDLDKQPQDEL